MVDWSTNLLANEFLPLNGEIEEIENYIISYKRHNLNLIINIIIIFKFIILNIYMSL